MQPVDGMRAEEFGRVHHLSKAQLAAVVDELRAASASLGELLDRAGRRRPPGSPPRVTRWAAVLRLPVVQVLSDGTFLSVVVEPTLRGAGRERILAAARAGEVLDPVEGHVVRVIEYDVPDRVGNGTGELIVLLSTITDPVDAHADELAAAYHERWEEETANDQLKTPFAWSWEGVAVAVAGSGSPGDLGLVDRASRDQCRDHQGGRGR